jgi:hypothetical protein
MTPTVDGTFDLVARIYQRALLDARQGNAAAIEWLDVVAPDWRMRVKRQQHRRIADSYADCSTTGLSSANGYIGENHQYVNKHIGSSESI